MVNLSFETQKREGHGPGVQRHPGPPDLTPRCSSDEKTRFRASSKNLRWCKKPGLEQSRTPRLIAVAERPKETSSMDNDMPNERPARPGLSMRSP